LALVLACWVAFLFGLFSFLGKLLFIFVFGGYLLLNIVFSLQIALREGLKLFPALVLAFFSRHFGYGLGSLWALVRIIAF